MIDPFLVHEILYGSIDFPNGCESDIARVSYICRENDISPNELKHELQKHINNHGSSNDTYLAKIFIDAINKMKEVSRMLVQNLSVLDTKLYGNENKEYGVHVFKSEGDYIVVAVLRRRVDDEWGNSTGIPHAEFWESTPARYYLPTIMGHTGDFLIIDGGSNWKVRGMNAVRKELQSKYKEMNETVRAKKVYENLN